MSYRGDIANGEDGATTRGRLNGDRAELFNQLQGRINFKRRRIGFLGESNGDRASQLGFTSWAYWCQVMKPRLWELPKAGRCAVSGSRSGAYYNSSTGAVTSAATDGYDMNTPIVKAKALAANVDDWFISANGNDGDSVAYSSYRNNREMVDYLRANNGGKRFIFWSCVLPKQTPQGFVPQLHAYMRKWADTTPDVFFLELGHLLEADQTGYNAAATGVNYAPVEDAIGHIAAGGAYMIAKYAMNDFLDQIGIPGESIRATNSLDAYSATNTGGNVFGLQGSMGGANPGGAYIGPNASGVTIPGSQIQTDNAELTVVGSKTTVVYKGQTHNALRLTLNAASTLTATRQMSITFAPDGGIFISPTTQMSKSLPLRAQLIAKPNALRDCCNISYNVQGNDGTNTYSGGLGGRGAIDVAAVPSLDEVMHMIPPFAIDLSAVTNPVGCGLSVSFPNGTTAGALGSIDLLMNGLWSLPVLPSNF